MRTIKLAALAAVAALSMSGGALAQDKDKAKVCEKFSKFQGTVNEAQQMGPDTQVKEAKRISHDLKKEYREYAKTAEKYAKPQVKNLERSIDELEKTVKRMPNDATLAQARTEIQDDVRQVRMAHEQLDAKLQCGMGGAGMEGQEQPQK